MKRIFGVIAMTIIFWSVFTLLVNAQENKLLEINLSEQTTSYKDVEGVSSEDEWSKIVESTPIEKQDNTENLVETKEPVKMEVLEVISKQKFNISIGIGNSYNVRDKRKNKEIRKLDYKNSPAFSTRVGYSPWKYIEIEGEYSKINNFVETKYVPVGADCWKLERKLNMTSLTLNLKIGVPLKTKDVFWKPYYVIGIGTTKSKKELSFGWIGKDYEKKGSYSSSEKCLKIGLGIEIKLYKNLFLFFEDSSWSMKSKTEYMTYYHQVLMGSSWKF
jgi:Outer membrane protein beta-barrel domain